MCAGLELRRHLWVHGNHKIPFLGHSGVPFFFLGGDPVSERLSDHSGADVDEPLFWNFLKIRVIRQVVIDVSMIANEVENSFHRQVLILRYEHGFHVFILNFALLLTDEVLQEVHGGVICRNDQL